MLSLQNHRLTESWKHGIAESQNQSQNGGGWQGPLEVIWSSSLLK